MKILALAVLMFLSISGNVFAILSGGGTQANPYLIQSLADFDEFADSANAATYWASGVYTKLMCDLDLAGTTYTQAVIAPDTSTSDGFQGTQFSGIFDGSSHNISNLTIPTITATSKDYIGLFGCIGTGGQVKNVGIEVVNIAMTGGLYIGGVAGWNSGTLTCCNSAGSVTGGVYVGGLVGWNESGTITSCYTTGWVTCNSDDVGGLVGYTYAGSITTCYSTCSVNGYSYVGGLVGASSFGTLTGCYAAGPITGRLGDTSVSGLLGSNYSDTVTGCFWDMDTSGQATSAGGTGMSNVQMKTLSTFTGAGWDFSATDGDAADWVMQWPGEYYPRLACQPVFAGDLNNDRKVDFGDFASLAKSWLVACSEPDWCEGADINLSGEVNYGDVMVFASNWLRAYYTLSASVSGGNGAVAPSSHMSPDGGIVGVTATPNSGYKVKAWYGTNNDLSKSRTNTVTMNSNKEVTVEFELITYYQLNTSVASGSGSISPSSQQYPEGTIVTLTATPSSYYIVTAWHGTNNDSSKSTTNTVTMNAGKNVTVEFAYAGVWPNGGFEMGDFTYWAPSGEAYIDVSLTEGSYSALLFGGTLSRVVNLPSYGDYTVTFDYLCGVYSGSAYVLINGQLYSLNADEQVHTFMQNLIGVSSFSIQFVASGDVVLGIDNCSVVTCYDCQMGCNFNGICEPWEMGTGCPDCGGGPVCGNGICEPGEEEWCEDCWW